MYTIFENEIILFQTDREKQLHDFSRNEVMMALLIIWADVVLRESRADRLNTWRNIPTNIIWTGAFQMKTSSAWTCQCVSQTTWSDSPDRPELDVRIGFMCLFIGQMNIKLQECSIYLQLQRVRYPSSDTTQKHTMKETFIWVNAFRGCRSSLLLKTGGFVPSDTHVSS